MTTSRRHHAGNPGGTGRSVSADGFTPACCDKVIEMMGAGFGLTAFAGSIGASRAAVEGWMAAHAGFAEAVARARAARVFYWEQAALRVASEGGASGAATIIMFALRSIAPDEYAEGGRQERPPQAGDAPESVDDRTLARATALILNKGLKLASTSP
jgi:transposase